jgi:hypothetical protein
MKTPTPWLYGLAVVVVLNIVSEFFSSPAIRMFRMPLILAAYVIGIVLFFKLGFWPALALWWGIGLVIGLLRWSYEFRRARHSKDADVKPPSLVTVVRGLFAWPLVFPFVAFGWVVVKGLGGLYSLYERLLPNRVPHYGGIERCKKAAISGDARAQATLGSAYGNGVYGLPQDYAESAKWYRKAAEQNYGSAQLNLGVCLAEGKGVEKNVVEGLMWILLARRVGGDGLLGLFVCDAAAQQRIRLQAHMTEQQIAEAYARLESLPLFKEWLSGASRKEPARNAQPGDAPAQPHR